MCTEGVICYSSDSCSTSGKGRTTRGVTPEISLPSGGASGCLRLRTRVTSRVGSPKGPPGPLEGKCCLWGGATRPGPVKPLSRGVFNRLSSLLAFDPKKVGVSGKVDQVTKKE